MVAHLPSHQWRNARERPEMGKPCWGRALVLEKDKNTSYICHAYGHQFLIRTRILQEKKTSSVNSWKYLSKIPTDDPLPVLKMVITKVYMKY